MAEKREQRKEIFTKQNGLDKINIAYKGKRDLINEIE